MNLRVTFCKTDSKNRLPQTFPPVSPPPGPRHFLRPKRHLAIAWQRRRQAGVGWGGVGWGWVGWGGMGRGGAGRGGGSRHRVHVFQSFALSVRVLSSWKAWHQQHCSASRVDNCFHRGNPNLVVLCKAITMLKDSKGLLWILGDDQATFGRCLNAFSVFLHTFGPRESVRVPRDQQTY
jgi:hypothetical protein